MIETQEQEFKRLHAQKDALITSKGEHETKLLAIKNLIRSNGRMPGGEYRQCCDSQVTHRRAIQFIDAQLRTINAKLREISCANSTPNHAQETNEPPSPMRVPPAEVRELSDIRDKWSEIAADENFHPPYRLAASQIVRDLNPILKRLCAP